MLFPFLGYPVITPSGPVVILQGNDFSAICEDSGDVLYYEWLTGDGVSLSGLHQTPQQLTLSNVTQSDTGMYMCNVTYINSTSVIVNTNVSVESKWNITNNTHGCKVLIYKCFLDLSFLYHCIIIIFNKYC